MSRPDHSTYREWLNLEADGGSRRERAGPPRRAPGLLRRLPARARRARSPSTACCERRRCRCGPDFRDSVMSALPTAGWEARSPRAWRFTAAVIVLLGGLAAALLVAGSASRRLGASAPCSRWAACSAPPCWPAPACSAPPGRASGWSSTGDLLAGEPRGLRLPGALPEPAPDLADPPPPAGRRRREASADAGRGHVQRHRGFNPFLT